MIKKGSTKFANATAELAGKGNPVDKIIYIVLDGEIISSPIVDEPIRDGKGVISGEFTVEEASNLANLIRAGCSTCGDEGFTIKSYWSYFRFGSI